MSIQSHDEDANDPKVYVGPNTSWYGIARVVYGWTDARDERTDRAWWKTTMLRSFGFGLVPPHEERTAAPECPNAGALPAVNGYVIGDVVAPLQEDEFFSDIPDFAGGLESPKEVQIGRDSGSP